MIDKSRAGLNLKGVLIMGQVELICGQEAQLINHSIHLKYVKPEALSDIRVSSYLSEGDDVTVKIHMDRLITWNLADSAGKALRAGGWFHPLDNELENSWALLLKKKKIRGSELWLKIEMRLSVLSIIILELS